MARCGADCIAPGRPELSGRVVATRRSGAACAPLRRAFAGPRLRSGRPSASPRKRARAAARGRWRIEPTRKQPRPVAERRISSGASCARHARAARGFRAAEQEAALPRRRRVSPAARRFRALNEALVGRRVRAAEALPKPHSAIGCKGVFWRSCEALHSTQVCGVSARRREHGTPQRASSLPSPGSPTISTSWHASPARPALPAAY